MKPDLTIIEPWLGSRPLRFLKAYLSNTWSTASIDISCISKRLQIDMYEMWYLQWIIFQFPHLMRPMKPNLILGRTGRMRGRPTMACVPTFRGYNHCEKNKGNSLESPNHQFLLLPSIKKELQLFSHQHPLFNDISMESTTVSTSARRLKNFQDN